MTPADCVDDCFCTELKLGQHAGDGGRDLFNHVLMSSAEHSVGFLEGNIEQERKTVHDKVGTSGANTEDDAACYAKQ